MTTNTGIHNEIQKEMRVAWYRYLDLIEPFRPNLHNYCLRMTRNFWDAEDLTQDTLLRSFAKIGALTQDIDNPQSYLLRTATNLWIDRVRRSQRETNALEKVDQPTLTEAIDADSVRNGAEKLIQNLPSRQRAAVVLKDVFDYSLKEIAEILETTDGAVKAALHRGRDRLKDPSPPSRHERFPSKELLDRFVNLFAAHDVDGLAELLLDNVSVEVVGVGQILGRDAARGEGSWLERCLFGHPDWPGDYNDYTAQEAKSVLFEGEPVVQLWRTRPDGQTFEEIWRFEEEEGRVSRIRDYCFCPETLKVFSEHFNVPLHTYGYRPPILM